jgi:hypothetical protein
MLAHKAPAWEKSGQSELPYSVDFDYRRAEDSKDDYGYTSDNLHNALHGPWTTLVSVI